MDADGEPADRTRTPCAARNVSHALSATAHGCPEHVEREVNAWINAHPSDGSPNKANAVCAFCEPCRVRKLKATAYRYQCRHRRVDPEKERMVDGFHDVSVAAHPLLATGPRLRAVSLAHRGRHRDPPCPRRMR